MKVKVKVKVNLFIGSSSHRVIDLMIGRFVDWWPWLTSPEISSCGADGSTEDCAQFGGLVLERQHGGGRKICHAHQDVEPEYRLIRLFHDDAELRDEFLA